MEAIRIGLRIFVGLAVIAAAFGINNWGRYSMMLGGKLGWHNLLTDGGSILLGILGAAICSGHIQF